ncbi:zinc-dependent peptidase [Parashewanella spongiae]|uniref:Zinc-dependent peptidase n=1 Tax=Parashewanella spongiae TaxID=342950 RepID=A0A3A6T1P4_9GAMM|nr:M90 family metallopeptidase [Parashewanella spongiae]MCL1080105.1 zinc-dependent peptidase [Parashewanella spongiae]RJY04936.1 zinc-dependent peptidase [Parashewanella spongiae]
MLPIILLLLVGVGVCTWLLSSNWRKQKRRKAVMSQPFPKQWRSYIKQRLPFFLHLPDHLKLQLKRHIQVFIDEKQFIGCDGMQITDEVKVTIAAQACLLLLNKPTDYYPKLRQILVYPAAFYVNSPQNDNGIVSKKRRLLLGESWQQGQVILSWRDTLISAEDPYDGHNLIFHEFAHQLDQESGNANGAPFLPNNDDYEMWSKILNQEFIKLQQCAEQQIPSLFDYYGATNPAEFFAVITEVFFEQPQAMHQDYPQLYQQLIKVYVVNPLTWD